MFNVVGTIAVIASIPQIKDRVYFVSLATNPSSNATMGKYHYST